MKKIVETIQVLAKRHAAHFNRKDFAISVCAGVVLLLVSFVINFYAGTYATLHASSSVTDVVLSNIRVFDVGTIFNYGPFVVWAIVVIQGIREPKRIPFILKSIALLLVIRSIFVTLTHVGPFPTRIPMTHSEVLNLFTFGGDLFFSWHTASPFLMALEFWEHRVMRYIFLAMAGIFGTIVLMAHVHYTVDVVSAFFITYGVFHIARRLFKKDWRLFQAGLET